MQDCITANINNDESSEEDKVDEAQDLQNLEEKGEPEKNNNTVIII